MAFIFYLLLILECERDAHSLVRGGRARRPTVPFFLRNIREVVALPVAIPPSWARNVYFHLLPAVPYQENVLRLAEGV